MLSVIIATEQAEWPVVSTLAALVSGAAAGVVRDVVLVDRHGDRAMDKIADVAGCHLERVSGTRGAALAAGAKIARGPWLMFLAPGAVPDPAWADEAMRFMQTPREGGAGAAALFTSDSNPSATASVLTRMRAIAGLLRGGGAEQGLVIAKSLYERLGGHDVRASNPERALMKRIARRDRTILRARLSLL